MILLDKLDLATRLASFRTLGGSRGEALLAVDRLRSGLKQLGVERLVVTFENGKSIEIPSAARALAPSTPDGGRLLGPDGGAMPDGGRVPGPDGGTEARERVEALAVSPRSRTVDPGPHPATSVARQRSLVHRLELRDGNPTYVARFPHRPDSLETIALYSGVVLSTFGPLTGPLHFVRLALYELCANAVEHGHPLAAGVEIEMGLNFDRTRVAGWIRDRCAEFDPSASPLPALAERAAEGARRGYGLHMVHRILTSLTHEFDGSGNCLKFRKEIV